MKVGGVPIGAAIVDENMRREWGFFRWVKKDAFSRLCQYKPASREREGERVSQGEVDENEGRRGWR